MAALAFGMARTSRAGVITSAKYQAVSLRGQAPWDIENPVCDLHSQRLGRQVLVSNKISCSADYTRFQCQAFKASLPEKERSNVISCNNNETALNEFGMTIVRCADAPLTILYQWFVNDPKSVYFGLRAANECFYNTPFKRHLLDPIAAGLSKTMITRMLRLWSCAKIQNFVSATASRLRASIAEKLKDHKKLSKIEVAFFTREKIQKLVIDKVLQKYKHEYQCFKPQAFWGKVCAIAEKMAAAYFTPMVLRGMLRNGETSGLIEGSDETSSSPKFKLSKLKRRFRAVDRGKIPFKQGEYWNVKYLSELERQRYEVVFRNGKPYYKTTGEELWGTNMYVVDSRGRIFAARYVRAEFQHSSFTAGEPVAGAGNFSIQGGYIDDIRRGNIRAIDRSSGHYTPSRRQLKSVVKLFKSKGADLSHTHVIEKIIPVLPDF